jgi:integrase
LRKDFTERNKTMSKRGNSEGSIFQRGDGRWCAVIDLGWENGKRKRKSLYAATRKEVAGQLNKALREKAQGLPVVVGRQTVAQFLTYWLEHHVRSSVRPRTYESYELLSRVHIVPELGRIPLQQLAPQRIQAFLAAKLKNGKAPQTVRHMRTVLRRALNFAMKWGVVARNSAALVDPPRVERHKAKSLSPEEARQFLVAAEEERLSGLYVLSLSLGMRQGEVLGLRWADLELESENPSLVVNQALQRLGGEFRFVEPKTERSRRTIALPKSVVRALLAHRKRQAIERLAVGPRWKDFGLVFTLPDGSPIERKSLHKDFKRILAKAGLPDSRFHDLRHSAASLLIAQGVPLRTVMELLGHSSISITADIYSHIAPAMMREAADKMDSILARTADTNLG